MVRASTGPTSYFCKTFPHNFKVSRVPVELLFTGDRCEYWAVRKKPSYIPSVTGTFQSFDEWEKRRQAYTLLRDEENRPSPFIHYPGLSAMCRRMGRTILGPVVIDYEDGAFEILSAWIAMNYPDGMPEPEALRVFIQLLSGYFVGHLLRCHVHPLDIPLRQLSFMAWRILSCGPHGC